MTVPHLCPQCGAYWKCECARVVDEASQSLTMQISGTVDGAHWFPVDSKNPATVQWFIGGPIPESRHPLWPEDEP